jgi:hypothetical protein
LEDEELGSELDIVANGLAGESCGGQKNRRTGGG